MLRLAGYCGIDLHAEPGQICMLDEDGGVMETSRARASRPGVTGFSGRRGKMEVAIEADGWRRTPTGQSRVGQSRAALMAAARSSISRACSARPASL
jgi:hypothetical protein